MGLLGSMECGSTMITVLVLGASGMLGHVVCQHLSTGWNIDRYHVTGTVREGCVTNGFIAMDDAITYSVMSGSTTLAGVLKYGKFDYVINCIGVVKPLIDEGSSSSIASAIRINSEFPHQLAVAASEAGVKVIQIATDCVFSGINGSPYTATSRYSPTDIYGKTKLLGEVTNYLNFKNLRCSIIGPEFQPNRRSLWEWVNQSNEPDIQGYSDHEWNGVTTLAFARICDGIMSTRGLFDRLDPIEFVCPEDIVTKYDLVRMIRTACGRRDLAVARVTSPRSVSRVLCATTHNQDLWNAARYVQIPTIAELVFEMGKF